jgi:integrase
VDLRLYDLRHEALSRLFESGKYSVPEVALVSGHKDWKQLARYTQLRAANLHDR